MTVWPIEDSLLAPGDAALVKVLESKLEGLKPSNDLKSQYYESEQKVRQFNIATDSRMEALAAVVGWSGTVVDVLEERLDFEGWVEPGLEFGLDQIFSENNLDTEAGLGHLDSFIYGTSFVVVGTGGLGEPNPLITVESPRDVTGVWDRRQRRLSAALQRIRNDAGDVIELVLHKPDETVYLARTSELGAWHVQYRDEHRLGRVLVVPMVNRPRAGRIEGRSEISKAVRSLTDAAVRTILGMEVNREFYTSPQRWAVNLLEEDMEDENGNPVSAWQTLVGRTWTAPPPDLDSQAPEVKFGQFPQSSPGPYLEQVRGLAQLLSAEAAIPPTYLGFATDQAASADAIRAMEARLIKRAERRQRVFGKAWLEVAYLALLVRDGFVPDEFRDVSTKWRDPSTPTRSAAADEVTKYIAAGVLPPDSSVALDRAGFSPQEQKVLRGDRQRAGAVSLVERLRQSAEQVKQDPEVQAVSERRTPEPPLIE